MADRIRIIKHEAVQMCGSYEVRFPDGRASKFFYFDDVPGRRMRPELLTGEQALEQAREGGVEQTYADMLRFFVLAVYVAELLRIGCKNRLAAFVRSRLHWRVAVGIAKEDYPVSSDHTYYITIGKLKHH